MAPLFLFFFLYRVSPVVFVIRWHLQMRVKFIGPPATLLTWQSHLQNGECHAHYCKQFAPFVPPDKWQKGQMAQNIFQAPWRRQSEMLPKFCCQHTHTHTHVPQRAKHTHTHAHVHRKRVKRAQDMHNVCIEAKLWWLSPQNYPAHSRMSCAACAPAVFVLI